MNLISRLPRWLVAAAVLAGAPQLSAQGFDLEPGDVIIADDTLSGPTGWLRILHKDGSLETIASGTPLFNPAGVYIDRDGNLLVSCWNGQWTPENGIYRFFADGRPYEKLNTTPLEDNFRVCRDSQGDVVVADGFAGLARIDESGNVDWFSPPGTAQFETNIGVLWDMDGNLLVSEAPNYLMGSLEPGRIFEVDLAGDRQLFAFDPNLLPNPNGIALNSDGSLLATDASTAGDPRHSLVRVNRFGQVQRISDRFVFPTDVAIVGRGHSVVAAPGEEAVVWVRPDGSRQTLVSEDEDGNPSNGLPVDRPYALTVVPALWLSTPFVAQLGTLLTFRIESLKAFAGQEVILAISTDQGPYAMANWWSWDAQFSHLDLDQAKLLRGNLQANGEVQFLTWIQDPNLQGKVLYLQAFLEGERLLSNPVALPVR
ncbi:MAG: hypothetical protein DWQ01_03105 [Planctomycetota bacterium]|nr:MAG: hypothetical protein DWQ01_03105 [Planctomycetota bacterium]